MKTKATHFILVRRVFCRLAAGRASRRLGARNLFLGLAGLCWLSGCAAPEGSRKAVESTAGLGWPLPPDPPRIVYVQSIYRPADAGVRISGFSRFAQWLTGAGKTRDQLVKPFGLSADEQDNICLTDTGANTVCYYDRAHKKWQRWDHLGKLRFVSPVAVAKQKDLFYVADSGLGAVLVFTEGGKLIAQVTNRLERPSGLVLNGERLFVTEARRHCVVSFDLQGKYLSEFGRRGTGPGEFNFPTHIAADGQGLLYITDSMNSRVQVMDQQGQFRGQIGKRGDSSGQFSRPKGVAVDSFGHVYVVDALFDNLQVFDRTGRLLLYFGEAGAEPGQFWLANGIAITRQNEIFVADCYNHRLQVFKYVGQQ